MSTTEFYQRSLYGRQNSVAEEFWERGLVNVFVQEAEKAKLAVRCWSKLDLSKYNKKNTSHRTPADPGTKDANTIPVVTQAAVEMRATSNGHHKTESPVTESFTKMQVDLSQLESFLQATKHDHRVFYVRQRHSHARLNLTKDYFNIIAAQCQTFPKLTEYLLDFKFKTDETEVGPPRIAFNPIVCSSAGQTLTGFETAYVIRYAEFTNRAESLPFSLRQFVVYHKYIPNGSEKCSTWLLAGQSQRTERCVEDFMTSGTNLHDANPFELHVVFFDLALTSWRPYLLYLYDVIKNLSEKAYCTTIETKADSPMTQYKVDIKNAQTLKKMEDFANDVLLCLDSTQDNLQTLLEMYHRGHTGHETPIDDAITFALENQLKDVVYTRKKTEALVIRSQNTRALISAILERINGDNLDKQMSALQTLQQQGQEENAFMRQIAEKGRRDSASVRILTIITLIYLPCTVVSSFYSTQFVSREDSPTGRSRLEYAQDWWLFFAVSLPLTLFTITVWYVWANFGRLQRTLESRRACVKVASEKHTGRLAVV